MMEIGITWESFSKDLNWTSLSSIYAWKSIKLCKLMKKQSWERGGKGLIWTACNSAVSRSKSLSSCDN